MTYVNPEANQTTNLPSQLVETDKTASNSRGSQLRQIDGNDVGSDTSTESGQNTTSVQNTQTTSVVGTALKASTQREQGGRDSQTPLATNPVAKSVCEEGTEEGTGDEKRHDVFADQVSVGLGHGHETELFLEGCECYSGTDEGTRITDHVGPA